MGSFVTYIDFGEIIAFTLVGTVLKGLLWVLSSPRTRANEGELRKFSQKFGKNKEIIVRTKAHKGKLRHCGGELSKKMTGVQTQKA